MAEGGGTVYLDNEEPELSLKSGQQVSFTGSLISLEKGEQSRPLAARRSLSSNEQALHQWTEWRISLNEGLSHDLRVYHDDAGHDIPNPIDGRLEEEPFKNSVKVPSFGPNLRQTYGPKSGNPIQNNPLTDDVFLMYGIPRVNLDKKKITCERSKSAEGQ